MGVILQLRHGAAKRILRGHDHFWTVMRTAHAKGEAFTVSSIARLSNARRPDITQFVRKLLKGGWIEQVGEVARAKGGRPEKAYRIIRPQTATPVITNADNWQGRSRQQMWNVMRRQRGGWSASSLAADASTDEVPVNRKSALAYTTGLHKAGMLTIVDRGRNGSEWLWRLKGTADTGPKPPMILRSKMVYDQNVSAIVGPIEADEVQP